MTVVPIQKEVIHVDHPEESFDKPDVARKAVWRNVFDVISAESYLGMRHLIRKLEEARERDGCALGEGEGLDGLSR